MFTCKNVASDIAMGVGTFVIYFEHKEILLGVCLSDQDDRFLVLGEDGSEKKLTADRVVHAAPAAAAPEADREELLRSVKQKAVEQAGLAGQVESVRLWEAMEGRQAFCDFASLAKAAFGDGAGPDHEAAVLRALMQDSIRFKLGRGGFIVRSPEEAARLAAGREQSLQRQREVEEAITWLRGGARETPEAFAAGHPCIKLLKDFVVFGTKASCFSDIRQIINGAGIADRKACFELLVRLGIWDEDQNMLLEKHQVPAAWPEAVVRQVAELRGGIEATASGTCRREDLTGLHAVSIDEPSTRDIDDAISFAFRRDSVELGVHIADAASYLAPHSPLDREAARRGASLYMPEGKIPMIPQPVSEDMLSLRQGEPRPAVSVFIRLGPSGALLDYRWTLSTVRVAARLTYELVDQEISSGTEFSRLYDLLLHNRRQRAEAGASLVLIPDLQVRVGPQKHITVQIRDRETPGQMLVSECMILANYCAALFLKKKRMPALFRKQPAPSEMAGHAGLPEPVRLIMQRRSLKRVTVDSRTGPHSALGLPVYTTVSSPLRKYFDLVNQRQLVGLLRGGALVYSREELEDIVASVKPALTRIALVEHERTRYWILKHLSSRVGDILKGFVLDPRPQGCTILLTDYLLEVPLKAPARACGEMVSVRVEQVDPFEGEIKISRA